jgi:hypothetical protein
MTWFRKEKDMHWFSGGQMEDVIGFLIDSSSDLPSETLT